MMAILIWIKHSIGLNLIFSSAWPELESDNIGEQVSNGIKEKARQGKLITTHALWLPLQTWYYSR